MRSALRAGNGRAGRRQLLAPRARVAFACAAVIAVLCGAWLWVRDSSLVAVNRVTVTGETGPDASRIRQALVAAARTMTTLDVNMGALRTAVAPFPVVKQLQVSSELPHGLRIRVINATPVGEVQFDGQTVPVAADGRLLRDAVATTALPLIPLSTPPAGKRVIASEALGAIAVLAAAPPPLLGHIAEVTTIAPRGFVVQLRGGPAIYIGDLTALPAKWVAASTVLSYPAADGAAYIDVTDPHRPAAGQSISAAARSPAAPTSGGSVAGGAAGASAGATGGSVAGGAAGGSAGATGGSVAGTSGDSAAGQGAGGG